MVKFLAKTLREFPLVAANKIDKADKMKIDINLQEFTHQINKGDLSAVTSKIFPVSAKTGEGLSTLKKTIHQKLVAKGIERLLETFFYLCI